VKPVPKSGDLIGIGVGIAVAFLVPFFAGVGVDAVAHTGPVFLLIGLGLGIVSVVVFAFARFKQFL
jgi:hypothetical protein